jgi:hypothetical protein
MQSWHWIGQRHSEGRAADSPLVHTRGSKESDDREAISNDHSRREIPIHRTVVFFKIEFLPVQLLKHLSR